MNSSFHCFERLHHCLKIEIWIGRLILAKWDFQRENQHFVLVIFGVGRVRIIFRGFCPHMNNMLKLEVASKRLIFLFLCADKYHKKELRLKFQSLIALKLSLATLHPDWMLSISTFVYFEGVIFKGWMKSQACLWNRIIQFQGFADLNIRKFKKVSGNYFLIVQSFRALLLKLSLIIYHHSKFISSNSQK